MNPSLRKVIHMRGHTGAVNCLVACKPYSIIVSGSVDGTCIIWDSNRWVWYLLILILCSSMLLFTLSFRLCYINTLTPHEGPVTCLAVSPTLGDIATVCLQKTSRRTAQNSTSICEPANYLPYFLSYSFPHSLLHSLSHFLPQFLPHFLPHSLPTSLTIFLFSPHPLSLFFSSLADKKYCLRLWSINGQFIKRLRLDVQALSLCYTSAPEGVYVNVLIGGMANGTIRLVAQSQWFI